MARLEYLTEVKDITSRVMCDPYIKGLMEKEKEYSYSLMLHGISVAMYAGAMAIHFNKQDEMVIPLESVIRGALIHDIGKVEVNKQILEKKGRLTAEEYEYIKLHADLGYRHICENVGPIEKDIVLLHHEKLNGSGYPTGSECIPFYVQIVTVADMYDALISKRTYKRMYSHAEAMDILKQEVVNGNIDHEILCGLELVINNGYDQKMR